LLCDKVAPNVKMRDREFQYHELFDLENKYVLVYIWDPECGHCQKETPKLKRVYDSLRVEGVDFEVYAIANTLEYDKWHKFMDDKGLDWVNVTAFSPEEQAFRAIYDVRSNPQFYLLNQEREIIAKRINSWQVFEFIMHLEGRDDKKVDDDTGTEGKSKNKSKG
jgi:thiol-disulfide isomerase/thioredoxin